MSCWVVPSLAAEFLHIPVDQVLARITAGSIPTRSENGFTFVDVAPDSPRLGQPAPRSLISPPTFRLIDVPAATVNEQQTLAHAAPEMAEPEVVVAVASAEDEAPLTISWAESRRAAGQRRRIAA